MDEALAQTDSARIGYDESRDREVPGQFERAGSASMSDDWDLGSLTDDVPTDPTFRLLVVKLRPSSDSELTCVICCRDQCDLEFETRVAAGKDWHGWHGIHSRCADTIMGGR